jgi:hypothetical protein
VIGLAFLGVVAGHLPHGDRYQAGRKDPALEPAVKARRYGTGMFARYHKDVRRTLFPHLPSPATRGRRTRSPAPVGSRHRGVNGLLARLAEGFKSWSFSSRTARLVAALNEEAGKYIGLESPAMQVHRLVGVCRALIPVVPTGALLSRISTAAPEVSHRPSRCQCVARPGAQRSSRSGQS